MSCGNPWRWSLLSSYRPSSSTLLSHRRTPPSLTRFRIAGTRSFLPNRIAHIQRPIPDKTLTLSSLLQYGTLLASFAAPAAMAVTGDNNVEEDLMVTLVTGGIAAVLYLLVIPPIILNWLRLRWYKRRFVEMYFQFMFAFIFFPGYNTRLDLQNFDVRGHRRIIKHLNFHLVLHVRLVKGDSPVQPFTRRKSILSVVGP